MKLSLYRHVVSSDNILTKSVKPSSLEGGNKSLTAIAVLCFGGKLSNSLSFNERTFSFTYTVNVDIYSSVYISRVFAKIGNLARV